MKEMKKTRLNVYLPVLSIFILGFLNVFKMRFIIQNLGTDGDNYNGLYQMLAQILVYLSIIETGVRFPAISALFEPIVKNELSKIASLLEGISQTYKKIFWLTLLFGLFVFPLSFFAATDLPIFVVLSVTILFICRLALPYVAQEVIVIVNAENSAYLTTAGMNFASILGTLSSIIVLLTLKNFVVMVFFETAIVVIVTIILFVLLKKKYKKYYLTPINPSFEFYKEVRGSRNLRLADALMNNTDIIVVSVVLGTAYGSSFSTYNATSTILFLVVSTTIIEAIKGLLGKVYSEHQTGKAFISMLHDIKYINYFIISTTIPMICIFLKPFTEMFFHPQYSQTYLFIAIFSFYFYLRMLRTPYQALKISMNRYNDFSRITIINAILNISLSIVCTAIFGTIGVLLGSIVALLTTEFWFDIKKLEINENLFSTRIIIKELICNFFITAGLAIAGTIIMTPYLDSLPKVFIYVGGVGIAVILLNIILYSVVFNNFRIMISKILTLKN